MDLSTNQKSRPFPCQRALITGASKGLGKAFVESLLSAGVYVIATSRNPENGFIAPNLEWIHFDGGTQEGINSFLLDHGQRLEDIDLLILNAGNGVFGPWDKITTPKLRGQIDLLVSATLELSQRHAEARKGKPSTQVWISSMAAELSLPYMPAYVAAKAALSACVQSLILTKDPQNFTYIDFRPGDFKTEFNQNLTQTDPANPTTQSAWQQLEVNLNEGALPEQAANDLMKAILKGKSLTVRSGTFFQTRIAPLANKLFPRSCMNFFMRRYFKIN